MRAIYTRLVVLLIGCCLTSGLSLRYNIITQGHGGTLEVESTEGDGATFTITLPA